MGYTTVFTGELKFDKPLEPAQVAYIQKFNETRRMRRVETVAGSLSDPIRKLVFLPIGNEGGYFVGGKGFKGQKEDKSVVDYNTPPTGQPSLWCQWTVNDAGTYLMWDGGEKFYRYVVWLQYLIDNFFTPWGYKLNGEIKWQGEDRSDRGTIIVVDSVVSTKTIDINKMVIAPKLATVNVIEIPDKNEMGIQRMWSFADDPAGMISAEAIFKELALDNGCDEIEDCVSNGFYDNNETNYYVCLVHSTER